VDVTAQHFGGDLLSISQRNVCVHRKNEVAHAIFIGATSPSMLPRNILGSNVLSRFGSVVSVEDSSYNLLHLDQSQDVSPTPISDWVYPRRRPDDR
jgi:hypothetical protein